MSEERSKPKLEVVHALEESLDLSGLWIDTGLDDPLAETVRHVIPLGKPRDFFRVHPDPAYRRRCEIYKHKPEGAIEEEYFLLDKPMQGRLEEATPHLLIACVYRDGTPRLWPIRLPKDGERDNDTWKAARAAARVAIKKWVKLLWTGRTFVWREAKPGYAPDPAWERLSSFDDLAIKGFGPQGIFRNEAHPVFRDLVGEKPTGDDGGGDDL